MNLIPGVKVFSKLDLSDKIELSNGTIRGYSIDKEIYADYSFVPNSSWRPLTDEEKNFLIVDQVKDYNYPNNISIIRLPQWLFSKVKSYFANNIADSIEVLYQNIDFRTVTGELINYLQNTYLIKKEKFTVSGYSMSNRVHSLTTAYDQQENKYVGLHLDSWEDGSIYERENATNLICINIGKEPRYFLFINLAIMKIFDMCNLLDEKICNRVKISPNLLTDYFFEKFGNYPVIRIKLNPGEGYIAPTENIIHDGSIWGNKSRDIIFALRGFFKLY